MSDSLRPIHRREAKSGRVSYGDPVLIHDSSKTRVVLVPFFIPRSTGTELAIKLITYKKTPPPHDWVEVENKSISLREDSSRALLRCLREHFAIAEKDDDGEYIAIKVSDRILDLATYDPLKVGEAILHVLQTEDIAAHLTTKELGAELTAAFRGAIRLEELRSAVVELRQNLDSDVTNEEVYQKWCEKHSWAFGNSYIIRDEIRDISAGDTIDLLLPSVITGYRDLVELKRPDMDVLQYDKTHKNFYFAHEVSKAIGQCHRYLDILHDYAAKGLLDHPEIVAYHPRALIVIGRSKGWDEDRLRALHGLNSRLVNINVMTYDQLLAQGERLVEVLGANLQPASPEDEDITWDDIPF